MASQRLFLATLVLSLLVVSHAQTNAVILYKLESRSSIGVSSVTLQCSVGAGVMGNKTFYREVNGQIELVADSTKNLQRFTFLLWPSAEGHYYCQAGIVESNRILVLAYPVLDPRITSTRLAPVPLSDTVCVPCAYQPGRLDNRQQEVTWFKGMDQVDTSISQFRRYSIHTNFSLVIRDVESGDASDAYYCQVRVTTYNETVVKDAPFISVTVLDPIVITQPIREQIITPNRAANFPCKISGVPEPTIKWLFNGRELVNTSFSRLTQYRNELRDILTVTSEMDINASLGSGRVTCIGFHMEEGRMIMVSSEAHLIVLTDKLTPVLSVSQEGAKLHIQLPSVIPGQFDIIASYKFHDKSSQRLISHPTFRNTGEVNIAIPLDKLPNFRTFSVRVALSVANRTGGQSVESNQITIDEYLPEIITNTDCSCSNFEGVQPSSSNSALVGVLGFFIVMVIILILVIVVVGMIFFICYKRMKSYSIKNTETVQYDNGGGHFSSEEQDISKTPEYDLPKTSPHRTRKLSVSSHGSDAGDENSDLEDVADDHIHKNLEQWDENKKDIAEMAADHEELTVDDETGMVHSKEFAEFHHPREETRRVPGRGELPYVTNPAFMLRAREKTNSKMKSSDSQSSFEEIGGDDDDMLEPPKTM